MASGGRSSGSDPGGLPSTRIDPGAPGVPDPPGRPPSRGGALLAISTIILVGYSLAFFLDTLRTGPGLPAAGCPAGPDGAGRDHTPAAGRGRVSAHQGLLVGRRLDVNRAGIREISALPGLSDTVARAVAAERERRGGFRRPEDLLAVPGIKGKRLEKILPFLLPFDNN